MTTATATRTVGQYNATVYHWYSFAADTDRPSIFTAEVDDIGRMLRSNWVQCTGLEGTPKYDDYVRRIHPGDRFEIVVDDCEGYKNAIHGLGLPASYRR